MVKPFHGGRRDLRRSDDGVGGGLIAQETRGGRVDGQEGQTRMSLATTRPPLGFPNY